MAGSQTHAPHPTITDAVLRASLESVILLGNQLRDPVAVIDRNCNLIYANEAASAGGHRVSREPPTKCYAVFFGATSPCSVCPTENVLESGEWRPTSSATGEGAASCRIRKAYPLMAADGRADYVLHVLSRNGDIASQTERSGSAADGGGGSSEPDRNRVGNLIGSGAPMRQLLEMIRLVADSQATVLLQGESGTGKELVARTIHERSFRRERPFVVVDCGSLPETLLESELFGHVKGAFTGAVFSKKGLFEEADGGTVLLDEIADTSAHFQSKLLRVLQEGEIKPVGSSRSTKVDVRVISATNRDLTEQVKSKAFREDLYYRLAVLPLFLPPLRERREDIPLLARHFVAASCRRHRKPLRTITGEAMEVLTRAPWPGNIRELQHRIERTVVTAPGSELTARDLLGESMDHRIPSDLRSVARKAKHQAERGRILEALQQTSGNRAKASRMLNISRAGLYNKLRAYGIE